VFSPLLRSPAGNQQKAIVGGILLESTESGMASSSLARLDINLSQL
jgi:hypothetical protein